MSTIVWATAALAIGLTSSTLALAAMPAGIGQSGAAVRIEQSANGMEFVHMRRHHHRNGFGLFLGRQRGCENFRFQFDSDRCRFQHRRHNPPGIFFRSNDQFGHRHFEPGFSFSIGF